MFKKYLLFITLLMVILIYVNLINNNKINFLNVREKVDNLLSENKAAEENNSNFGRVDNENGKQKYFNNFYGINFTAPEDWKFSEKYIGNGVVKDNFVQMFNFKQDDSNKSFLQNQNKIEGIFSSNSNYSTLGEDVYIAENLKLFQINISNKKVNVAEGNYSGLNFKTYYMPTSKIDTYLNITIYGDVKNFYVLDVLVNKM